MRIDYLLALLLITSSHVVTQTSSAETLKTVRSSLALRGEVISIQLSDVDSYSVTIIVKLQLEAYNGGGTPVIVLTEESPQITTAIFTENATDSFNKALIVNHWGASVDRSSKWSALRSNLDKPFPPADKVRILKPDESWRFDNEIHIFVPTEAGKRSYFSSGASFEKLQQYSQVWTKLNWEVWPANVEPWGKDRNKLKFGRKLQRRWRDDGVLLLDVIQSQPIPLDLKTLAQRPHKRKAPAEPGP